MTGGGEDEPATPAPATLIEAQLDPPSEPPPTQPAPVSALDPTRALAVTHPRDPSADVGLADLVADLVAGRTIGRYEIVSELGRGGMGVVFHAYDPQLDRGLAIKLLRDQQAAPARPRGRALLIREARAIARVAHPNVIAVYDVGVHAGRIYVAMELVRGRPLSVWIRDVHGLGEVLDVFAQAARGLAAAHAAGLVHRDFKPANVLVGGDGRVRVLDFGLARAPDAASFDTLEEIHGPDTAGGELLATSLTTNLTIGGALAGTPAYMAPEQFTIGEAGPASDQFAFCVSLHEALFGVRPFVGESLWELRAAVTAGELVLPSAARSLPEDLLILLRRGLAKRGDDRLASMDLVADELDTILASLDDGPRVTVPLGFLPATAAAHSRDRAPSSSAHLSSYLGTLPRGLDSHPHCAMDIATVRFVLARHPLDPLEDVDELPRQILANLDAWAAADERFMPEVPARALLAAVYDRHLRSRAAWDELWAALARLRFTRGFSGFALPRGLDKIGPALARIWDAYHRGTRLELEPGDAGLELRLSYPRGLLDALGHAEVLQLAVVGLAHAGHRGARILAHDSDASQLRATLAVG